MNKKKLKEIIDIVLFTIALICCVTIIVATLDVMLNGRYWLAIPIIFVWVYIPYLKLSEHYKMIKFCDEMLEFIKKINNEGENNERRTNKNVD